MLLPGRIVFAVAIVGFGVLCLAYIDFVAQLQPVPLWVPGYGVLAVLTGVILVAAGLAIVADIRAYPAALALTVFFASWIVFLQVPSAFVDPVLLRSPWWVRTFEALAFTGGALVLAGLASRPPREGWLRVGRILFGVSLPVFGVLHFIYADNVASIVPPWYPWRLFWAYFTGLAQVAGGVAIAAGKLPRLAATLAGAMYGTWALTLHIPSQFQYDNPRAEQTSLVVAVAMCGAAWIVAGSLSNRGRAAPAKEPELAYIGPSKEIRQREDRRPS